MSEVVLDASAVLALLNQEPGSETISQFLDRAAISAVNFSEVIAKLAEAGVPRVAAVQILDSLSLEVTAFDQAQAIEAGMLRPITKSLGLSLGDRACLTLGLALKQPVVTTDRQWANLNIAIEIRVVR
jgi:PIN domain nuclease of toxin-antitoxin system